MDFPTLVMGAIARFGIRPYPINVAFELTWLCNLECKYCDRHTPLPKELTLQQIFKALSEFRELGMRTLHLDGGDPLTHRHVDEIVDWAVERDIPISLNTNGILVPRKINLVRKLSGIKFSLDGPREAHDRMRGEGSFQKTLEGARAAREAGVRVEFTCTVGIHNWNLIDETLAIAQSLGVSVVFQPALNSLFIGQPRDGSEWMLDQEKIDRAFGRVEELKRAGRGVANEWSSLRHFRNFPRETRPPCAAGWIMCTLDPEGVLFSCDQLDRSDRSNNVVELGAAQAFKNLSRTGCGQCWCARLVQDNYAWGLRFDKMLPPMRHSPR